MAVADLDLQSSRHINKNILKGTAKKTKTNSLWIVQNYAVWNSLIFYHWYLIPYSATVCVSVSGFHVLVLPPKLAQHPTATWTPTKQVGPNKSKPGKFIILYLMHLTQAWRILLEYSNKISGDRQRNIWINKNFEKHLPIPGWHQKSNSHEHLLHLSAIHWLWPPLL